MSAESRESAALRAIEREAAAWVVREERGLTPAEQDALSLWLAADPCRRAALAERRWAWREFDRLAGLKMAVEAPPDPDLLAPRPGTVRSRSRWLPWSAVSLAAAAVVAVAFRFAAPSRPSGPTRNAVAPPVTALAAPCEQRTLDDGTVVELNRGARLTVMFTPATRRVHLERGEAHFTVAKNPARPFVVEAAGVTARAVGTAFVVRLDSVAFEVVVTEGRVQLGRETAAVRLVGAPLILTARQRAVVALKVPVAPDITTLSEADLAARLAWLPRVLDFTDAPLAAIVGEFNRHNSVQLTLGSPLLAGVRLNASFRSDNVEGFVRLLESSFGLRAEWRGETEIALFATR